MAAMRGNEGLKGEPGEEVGIYLTEEPWGEEFVDIEVTEPNGLYDTRSARLSAREFFDAVRRLELQRK